MSCEYGWDTEYILSRTEREIAWRLEQIGIDFDNRLGIDATLHGMEYKAPARKEKVEVKITEDQQKKLDQILKESQARKRAKYGNRC